MGAADVADGTAKYETWRIRRQGSHGARRESPSTLVSLRHEVRADATLHHSGTILINTIKLIPRALEC